MFFAKLIVEGDKLSTGDKVQVRWGTQGEIYDAEVKDCVNGTMIRIRFQKMTADWDRWIPIEKVVRVVDFSFNV